MFNTKSRQTQLTGLDVLIGMATKAEEESLPYASQYAALLTDFVMPGKPLVAGQAVAQSELRPHEISPANVVRAASGWAYEKHQLQTLKEIADIGARMAAIWPRFLLVSPGGHPELREREDTPAMTADAEMVVGALLAEQKSSDAKAFVAQLRERGYTLVSVER